MCVFAFASGGLCKLPKSRVARFVSGHGFSRAGNGLDIRGFSPCRLLLCQIGETVRVLFVRINQPCFYRVLSYVLSMLQQALVVLYPYLRKTLLPDLSQVPEFFFQAIRESALDELDSPFDAHAAADRGSANAHGLASPRNHLPGTCAPRHTNAAHR